MEEFSHLSEGLDGEGRPHCEIKLYRGWGNGSRPGRSVKIFEVHERTEWVIHAYV